MAISNHVIIWICVSILVFIFLGVYLAVKKFLISKILADKESTLNTSLDAFRESYKYDTIVKGENKLTERYSVASISQRYEEMCILDPERYVDDPSLPKVIQDYSDLLKGKILDPDANNAPSEILEDIHNADYRVYLKAQIRSLRKAGKDVTWFQEELKRFSQCEKEVLFEADFILQLESLGATEHLLGSLVTENRMEKYTPEDWKELIDKVKVYDNDYPTDSITYFLDTIEDKSILIDDAKMEAFHKLLELGIDEVLAAAYIKNNISSEDLGNVAEIMESYSMTCDEALKKLLRDKSKVLKKATLKDTYARQIHS